MNLTKNKTESWLDMNYTSVLELLVTLTSLFSMVFTSFYSYSCYRSFLFQYTFEFLCCKLFYVKYVSFIS